MHVNEWEEADDTLERLNMDTIYSKYKSKPPAFNYPITLYKDRIVREIKANAFVVLEGPTACGKTN